MTSFAAYPHAMPPHDFDLFNASSNDSYAELMATTQGYGVPNASFFDTSFAAVMSTLDSSPSLHAPVHLAPSGDFVPSTQAAHIKQGYSPAASPPQHSFDSMPPPQPSTSSEAGASVHSTSSSALASPALVAQPPHMQSQPHFHEPWALGLSQSIPNHAPFVTSTLEQDLDRQPGFVGESMNVSSSAQSALVAQSPLSSIDFQSAWSGSTRSGGSAASTPQLTASHSPLDAVAEDRFSSPTAPFVPSTHAPWLSSQPLVSSKPLGSSVAQYPQGPLLSNQVWLPPAAAPVQSQPFVASSDQLVSSSFFNQSSGRFVPPLESSCRFPFQVFALLLLLHWWPLEVGLTDVLLDPSLINPFGSPSLFSSTAYGALGATSSPRPHFVEPPPSPAPSAGSSRSNTFNDSRRFKSPGSQSPYLHTLSHHPYGQQYGRRTSLASIHTQSTHGSGSLELDDESVQRGLCPIPECGRVFKDLKAHILTHQNERPEKCPIVTCEYHVKGFARKYDKNRHTLTHYKGTMVCGFCPGSGSAAEKSFNRADVFKRHLTSVHGVEQTPPNSRKKSPSNGARKGFSAADSKPGTCSTCGVTFSNVQDFYEHLDDCVMRVVQQTDPCEAINQKNLGAVQDDARVQETLDRHNLPGSVDYNAAENYGDADEEEDDEELADGEDAANDAGFGGSSSSSKNARSGRGAIKSRKDNHSS
ncbi:MAG: hypothetical protein INR71_03460 [Terriglobus roseus]|nr:hypothetical protein [Terriglobus roseus]